MTTTGIILWSLVIVFIIFGLMRKNRGDETENNHQDHGNANKQYKGGCCG